MVLLQLQKHLPTFTHLVSYEEWWIVLPLIISLYTKYFPDGAELFEKTRRRRNLHLTIKLPVLVSNCPQVFAQSEHFFRCQLVLTDLDRMCMLWPIRNLLVWLVPLKEMLSLKNNTSGKKRLLCKLNAISDISNSDTQWIAKHFKCIHQH